MGELLGSACGRRGGCCTEQGLQQESHLPSLELLDPGTGSLCHLRMQQGSMGRSLPSPGPTFSSTSHLRSSLQVPKWPWPRAALASLGICLFMGKLRHVGTGECGSATTHSQPKAALRL